MPGQSFVIGGLIDNRVAETVNRIPGLSSIPLLGKIFTSHNKSKNNTELLVLVTPEFPTPFDPGASLPDVSRAVEFMQPLPKTHVNPGSPNNPPQP
jgi:pilus assembly protein CpaC